MSYKITSLTATQKDGVVSVSGTTEDGALAVAISVYDSTGENLISLETTSVSDDNTFSREIELENDNYVVKVADYEGGEYKTVAVLAAEETSDDEEASEDSETSTASTADTGRVTAEASGSSSDYLAPVIAGVAVLLVALVVVFLAKRRHAKSE